MQNTIPVTPQVLRQRYNVTLGSVGGSLYNAQSVAEFGSNFYNPSDISKFYDMFWTGKNFTSEVVQSVGPNDASRPTSQASVDLQYLMGIAPDVPTWFWSVQQGNADFWTDLSEVHPIPSPGSASFHSGRPK